LEKGTGGGRKNSREGKMREQRRRVHEVFRRAKTESTRC